MAAPPPPTSRGPAPGGYPAPQAPEALGIAGRLLPLRRLTVADVLDGAVRVFRSVVGPAALLVLVVIGPLQLGTNLLLSRLAPGVVGGGLSGLLDLDVAAAQGMQVGLILTQLGSGLLGYLLSLIASAAVVALVLTVDRGEVATLTGALTTAVRVLVTTLVASLLLGLLGIAAVIGFALLSFLLLVIPILGVIALFVVILPGYLLGAAAFLALTSLVVPVAVVEGGGPLRTLSRTVWVFTRQPLRILWITLLVAVVVTALTAALQLPFLLVSEVSPAGGWAIESVGSTLGQVVSVPVSAAAALLVYLDTRVRLEGLDLRVRVRAVAGR
ncbi:MAG: hypothetical protein WD638_08350 [Nitriliruptoraceae bacterium]